MAVTLDTELASPQAVGPRSGVPERRLQARSHQLTELQQRLDEATTAGLLPHVALARDPAAVQAAVARGEAWRHRGAASADRVIVVGEPGAVAAARVLACAGDTAGSTAGNTAGTPGGNTAELVFIDQPDTRQVQAALAGARRPRLVVLAGPQWVRTLAEALRPQVRTATVFADEAEHPLLALASEPAEAVVAPGAADARFGVVGPAALALAGFARLPGAPLAAALSTMEARCHASGVRGNPALRLGALAAELGQGHGLFTPTLVVGGTRMQTWAAWASRAWAALSSRAIPAGDGAAPSYLARGACPLVLLAGDEALVQRVIAGPRDLWLAGICLSTDGGAAPDAALATLVDAHLRHAVRDGRPVVRLLLGDTEAPDLAALSWLWLQAAVMAAALDPIDPLTMDAADDWRNLVDDLAAGSQAR